MKWIVSHENGEEVATATAIGGLVKTGHDVHHKSIRRAQADQTSSPSSPAPCLTQQPTTGHRGRASNNIHRHMAGA